jgi:hypothetical protein
LTENGGAKLIITPSPVNTLNGVIVTGNLDLTGVNAALVIRNGLTLNGTVLLNNGGTIALAPRPLTPAKSYLEIP